MAAIIRSLWEERKTSGRPANALLVSYLEQTQHLLELSLHLYSPLRVLAQLLQTPLVAPYRSTDFSYLSLGGLVDTTERLSELYHAI